MRNRVGRRDKRVWFVVLGIFVTIFLFSFLVNRFKTMRENADAASLANFDPGYIISDYQMSNYNSMTEAEIQAFLTEKNPCGNTDYNYYLQLSANTNYKWHFEDGHFVCLSEELFGDGEVIGSGDTAAHIIWQAAQDYKINPQVLIVLIQKETALITDTIPNDGDYRKATGFGCPDTAACSSDYYGFKNQVRNAAKLFREVLDGGWTNYPIGNNYIQYNPNASCGGSVVNIQNLATSALYRYTPYQPNDAALTAGYGEAVCGAYGNRNFYLYFEDWFGGIGLDGWEALDTPRYFEIKEDALRINPYTELESTESIISKGTVLYFTSKIILSSDEQCLRTEHNTENDIMACVPISLLNEVILEYEDIPEDEQYKIINSGASKQFVNGKDLQGEPFEISLVKQFVKQAEFMGKKYYFTKFDMEYNTNIIYGLPEEMVTDIEYYKIEEYMTVQDENASKIDLISESVTANLEKGVTRLFKAKIVLGDSAFYQTEYDFSHDEASVVSEKYLANSYDCFVNFEQPRALRVKYDVDRIDPIKGTYYSRLTQGMVIEFETKIYINGQWYYRTKHNTENDLPYAVPAFALEEI